ncbi:hypothetical protein AVEN_259119-1 [Araneus ventricosus]|uniref:Uncharacterized protein n=1 Tax=Araneus ventricosus TaxID=182803 RepID=A0A4Y2LDG7_ARAVE|nr:hypothetical protein AVEN_259119-1 [Araneus ventricosus]
MSSPGRIVGSPHTEIAVQLSISKVLAIVIHKSVGYGKVCADGCEHLSGKSEDGEWVLPTTNGFYTEDILLPPRARISAHLMLYRNLKRGHFLTFHSHLSWTPTAIFENHCKRNGSFRPRTVQSQESRPSPRPSLTPELFWHFFSRNYVPSRQPPFRYK